MELLTADDIVKKRFRTTEYREGYDQTEVDDFLDQVVATIRALTRRIADLEGGPGVAEDPS